MRSRKSQCLTSETFLLIMVRNQILVYFFFLTLFFNKLLCKFKKTCWSNYQSSNHRLTPPPAATLFLQVLLSPRDGNPKCKGMGGGRKPSSCILMKLSFDYLGSWGWEKMLGIFVCLTDDFKHLSSITSSLCLCFCLASIHWIAGLMGQCHLQSYQRMILLCFLREHSYCSWNKTKKKVVFFQIQAPQISLWGSQPELISSPL